jgi:hypothetical protein
MTPALSRVLNCLLTAAERRSNRSAGSSTDCAQTHESVCDEETRLDHFCNKGNSTSRTKQEKNKALILEAFDTLFNKRDYVAAGRYWSRDYIQQSAHIGPSREGLFNLIWRRAIRESGRPSPRNIALLKCSRMKGTIRLFHWWTLSILGSRSSACPILQSMLILGPSRKHAISLVG